MTLIIMKIIIVKLLFLIPILRIEIKDKDNKQNIKKLSKKELIAKLNQMDQKEIK